MPRGVLPDPTASGKAKDAGELSLDPADWEEFRETAHRALDDAIDFLRTVRERPVWRQVPEEVRSALAAPVPTEGEPLEEVYREFQDLILPYATGNIHPRFFGWVHGTGLAGGIVSEMLTASMNANCGGRDHGAIYVERTVVDWCKKQFDFPEEASGLLVSGTSMANLIGLGVARNSLSGANVRTDGVGNYPRRLTGYASAETHESVAKAFEIMGLGGAALRKIPVDEALRIRADVLRETIAEDHRAGLEPFCVIGSAGTVNTGAIDDLDALATLCERERLWFHVDGAFGALGVLSDSVRPLLKGIERADSIAFDFHKWMFVQYDAGCILVRDGAKHRAAYSMRPPYLNHLQRGLAGGGDWPCDFGPELSRSFRALKVWFAMKEHGTRKLGRMIDQNCAQAQYLRGKILEHVELELLAPVQLNIVCFRFHPPGQDDPRLLDRLNEELVADLQESGVAVPSTTRIGGRLAVRVAITNHRSRIADFDILLAAVVEAGGRRMAGSAAV